MASGAHGHRHRHRLPTRVQLQVWCRCRCKFRLRAARAKFVIQPARRDEKPKLVIFTSYISPRPPSISLLLLARRERLEATRLESPLRPWLSLTPYPPNATSHTRPTDHQTSAELVHAYRLEAGALIEAPISDSRGDPQTLIQVFSLLSYAVHLLLDGAQLDKPATACCCLAACGFRMMPCAYNKDNSSNSATSFISTGEPNTVMAEQTAYHVVNEVLSVGDPAPIDVTASSTQTLGAGHGQVAIEPIAQPAPTSNDNAFISNSTTSATPDGPSINGQGDALPRSEGTVTPAAGVAEGSAGSDTDTSKPDSLQKEDSAKHHSRTNSMKKPVTFKKTSVTKNFLAKSAGATPTKLVEKGRSSLPKFPHAFLSWI